MLGTNPSPEDTSMAIDWSPFVALVQRHNRFLITTHVRPDPDGLGSMLGLASVLEGMGKTTQMVISSVWPPRYDFLDPARRIGRMVLPGAEFRQADAIIVLDTGTWGQLAEFGDFMKTFAGPKVVIDHHLSQDPLGALALVDTTAEATGRLIFEAAEALGQKLTPAAADFLFAALATDTGWFRHKNTTAPTYALAEKLVRAGANPTRLYELIYEQSTMPRFKLTALVLERLQAVDDGKIAYSQLFRDDYAATGAIPSDTEEMINYPRALAGVEVAMFFMEQPAGGVKVSFRSREKVNVAQVAETFGGGGHRLASGAILPTSMDQAVASVLAAVRARL